MHKHFLSDSSLTEYLYQSQLRLIITDHRGVIELMTPVAAQMLTLLTQSSRLINLFELLKPYLPQLSTLIERTSGDVVCDDLQFEVPWRVAPRVMSLNLHRLGKDKFLTLIADVTDKARQLESSLALQLENLHIAQDRVTAQSLQQINFYDFSPVGFVSLNRAGVILNINLVGAKILGRERSELTGKRLAALFLSTDRQYFKTGLDRLFGSAQKYSGELQLTGLPGVRKSLRMEGTLSPDGQECRAVLQDITDWLALQKNLIRNEERYRTAMEASSDGLWDWDIAQNSCYCSPGYFRLLGYRPDAFRVPSPEWEAIIYPQDLIQIRAEFEQFLRSSGKPLEIKCRMKAGDGSWKWVLCKGRVVVSDAHSHALRAVGSIIDITQQRKAELALARAQTDELEVANRIQQTLLLAPPSRQHEDLWMSCFNQAARGIDGDFFDAFRIGQDAVDVIVGDVMGKGVAAALIGAATKLQFSRSLAELLMAREGHIELPQPSEIVTAVNHAMAQHLQSLDVFVTLVYLRFDLKENRLTWVGCGHEETLIVTVQGNEQLLANQHTPIGLTLDEEFVQNSCRLDVGDAVFLCSDGAADALMENGQRLGRQRLNRQAAKQMRHQSTPAMALHTLRRELQLKPLATTDDLTMVMLMRKDPQRCIDRLELSLTLSSLRRLRQFMANCTTGLAETSADLITVAAVEVVTNVIRHAGGLIAGAPIEILAERNAAGLVVEFKYLGERFEPPELSTETDFSQFPEGGFGLQIIRQACDKLAYSYSEGVNTLRLFTNQ